MKLGSKRGAAVLEAPEETYALADGEFSGWEPAPAGTLHRGAAGAFAAAPAHAGRVEDEEPYVPRRGKSGVKVRLRPGMPKSTAGWLVFGSLTLLAMGGLAVTTMTLRHSLYHDDRFAVATSSEIEIEGNQHVTRGEILSVFGADLERNIFKVPLAERRADLERLPWVEHATVMRLLPNHLRIAVVERKPVAFAREGTQIGLVDANGVLLDMPADEAGDPKYSFPVLTGLNASDPLSVRAARMAVYAKFMKDLGAGGANVTQSLSEVDVSNPEDVKAVVALHGADVLVHFGDEDFLERYQQFRDHLPEWRQQYPKLASADMRYEHQVVLEMAAGTNMAANGAIDSSAAGSATPADGAAQKDASLPALSSAADGASPAVKAAAPVLPHGAKAEVHAPVRAAAGTRAHAASKNEAAKRAMELRIARARASSVAGTVAVKQTAAAGQGVR